MVSTAVKPIAQIADEFSSDEMNQSSNSFPYAQVLNKQAKSPGLFVTQEQQELVEWKDQSVGTPHNLILNDGDPVPGIRIIAPRLLIVRSTPLYMANKESGEFMGKFNKKIYDSRQFPISLRTKYLLFFLDGNNKPVHDLPLQYTGKGAPGYSFNKQLSTFRTGFEKAFAESRGERTKQKNEKFHALTVFCPEIKAVEAGTKPNTSWVTSFVGHPAVTADNVKNFFVGYDADLKDMLWALHDSMDSFASLEGLSQEVQEPEPAPAALPADTGYNDYPDDVEF